MPAQQYHINSLARSAQPYAGLFDDEEYRRVEEFFISRSHHQPTPLLRLRGLAAEIGVRDIFVKDESARFGLNAFKILGVTYAVGMLLEDGRLDKESTLVCATEGYHGRAVARVAARRGL